MRSLRAGDEDHDVELHSESVTGTFRPQAVWRRRVAAGALAVAVTVALSGCASTSVKLGEKLVGPEELLNGGALGVPDQTVQLVDESEVLAVSDDMKAFLDRHVNRRAFDPFRLRQLINAIMSSDSFGLTYDGTTRTAAETFATQRGNCLSFSNMFVAMARHVDLSVQFQEVEIPPDWTREGDAYVLNQHVNVLVDLGSAVHAVDFNIEDFRASYDRRLISDERALAHFYNNKGVELMQAGEPAAALASFREALFENDRSFAPAWTNLGILYLRLGHTDHAKSAFVQALEAAPGDLVALSNLARFYELAGDRERARVLNEKVARHRRRNPYYRYQLSREAVEAGDYDAAIGHLKYAVRRKRNEDRFYLLLGLCYLKQGEEARARLWFDRAREVAAGDALKRKYESKIDLLLSGS